jgi:hypothetical protein
MAARSSSGYRYSAYCKTHTKTRRSAYREWIKRHPEQRRAQSVAYDVRKAQADEPPRSSGPADEEAD